MAPKRQLGIGKAQAAKKQRAGTSESAKDEAPIVDTTTIELCEEADADDEQGQLLALWHTYTKLNRDSELLVNGVVHECDRLLRASKGVAPGSDGTQPEKPLPASFYAVYALALAELAKYHLQDVGQVAQYYEMALEFCDAEEHSEDARILFARSQILLNQIALQYVAHLDVSSVVGKDCPELSQRFDECLRLYDIGEKIAMDDNRLFNSETHEILCTVNDLLEIVDRFGHDDLEEEDEDEDEDDGEEDEIVLEKNHPLQAMKSTDKYNKWWRKHTFNFYENMPKDSPDALVRKVAAQLGQANLQSAQPYVEAYNALEYDDDYADKQEFNGLSKEKALQKALEHVRQGLDLLETAQDADDVELWVVVAEAHIALGNLYPVDSFEQESEYAKAQGLLIKANNVTNGKYQEVLDNLLDE